jgi:molecular chaperone Hsp33
MNEGSRTDYAQPFLFDALDIRGRLVCLSGAWRGMTEGRDYPAAIAELLGHTTALAVLLGAGQKQADKRVTLQVRGDGKVPLLVADCDARLQVRGIAHHGPAPEGSVRELIGDGRMVLTLEDDHSSGIYQSVVPLEGDTLQDIFEHYISQSEQLPAFLRLYADEHSLCGLLLEKLPDSDARDADGWNRVTHLASTLTLAETRDARPYDLLTRLFPEELLRVFKLHSVRYHCPRDEDKVKDMLRSLGRAEVESILVEKGEVMIRNEMCNHEYRFGPDILAELFDARPAS